jgi:hypothetical protein
VVVSCGLSLIFAASLLAVVSESVVEGDGEPEEEVPVVFVLRLAEDEDSPVSLVKDICFSVLLLEEAFDFACLC